MKPEKPTPGPWHRCRVHPDWIVLRGDGDYLARLHGGNPTAEANAALIAASPKLADVLRWIVACWGKPEDEWIRPDMHKAIEAGRTALTEALGADWEEES